MNAVGLIAGGGRLPFVAAAEARAQGRRVVAVGIRGETDPALAEAVDALHWVRLGQLGAVVKHLQRAGANEALMVGRVAITHLFSAIRPDLLGARVLLRARDRRGDSLLEAIVEILHSEGIRVLETPPFLGPVMVHAGLVTRRAPSASERKDIALGRGIARQIAALRIGQTVVVKRGTVVAVESVEGTDAAIRRGGDLGRGGVVVVKVARADQDLRFDLPTIGPETLTALRDARATALAVDAGRTLLLERERFIAEADSLHLAVVAGEESPRPEAA